MSAAGGDGHIACPRALVALALCRQVGVQGIFAEPGFGLNGGQAQPNPNPGSSRKACETRQSLRLLRCGMNNSLIYKVGIITLP